MTPFRSEIAAGTGLVLAATLLWSTGAVFLRESGLGPFSFMAVGNLAGTAWILATGRGRLLREAAAAPRSPLLALVLFGALNACTYFAGLSIAPIVPVLSAHYVAPVLVALAAPAILGERPGGRVWVGLALSLLGIAPLVAAEGPEAAEGARRLGVVLGLLSAVGYAGLVLSVRRLASGGSSPRVVSLAIAAGLLPFVLPFADLGAITVRGASFSAAAGLLHLPLAAVLYARGAERLPAAALGILAYSEIVFAAVWGLLLYGEPLGPATLAGAALVVAGGAVVLSHPSPPSGTVGT